MNQHLKETLEIDKGKFKGGEYIESYNRNIRRDGIAGTIYAGIDSKNQIFVVVRDVRDRWDAEASKYKK